MWLNKFYFIISDINIQLTNFNQMNKVDNDNPLTKPKPDTEVEVMDYPDEENSTQNPCKVILFNDEIHTFDEVSSQIIIATKCSSEKAEALTWEVHSKGKAIVYSGDMNECLKVSGILEEIALHTQIEM